MFTSLPNGSRTKTRRTPQGSSAGPYSIGICDLSLFPRRAWVAALRRAFASLPDTGLVNLGLRLDRQRPVGRLVPSNIHDTMRLQIAVADVAQVDTELQKWLKRAYAKNA